MGPQHTEEIGDVQAYAEATGQSESTAYRQTQEAYRHARLQPD